MIQLVNKKGVVAQSGHYTSFFLPVAIFFIRCPQSNMPNLGNYPQSYDKIRQLLLTVQRKKYRM